MLRHIQAAVMRAWVRMLIWADLESDDHFGGGPPMGGAAA